MSSAESSPSSNPTPHPRTKKKHTKTGKGEKKKTKPARHTNTFFLINTLYLYSRDTNDVLNYNGGEIENVDMTCINSINYIFYQAREKELFNNDDDIQNINIDKLSTEVNKIFAYFLASFSRVGANLLKNKKFEKIINRWSLYKQEEAKTLFITPEKLFETIKYLDHQQQIYLTFDYVIFLFAISLTVNHNFNWRDSDSSVANLYRHNSMLISFLSIFISYFKPLLDELQTQTTDENRKIYSKIITFINWVIKIHNVGIDTNPPNDYAGTTYKRNIEKNKAKSAKLRGESVINNNLELSYDILENYNKTQDDYTTDYQTSFNNSLSGEKLDCNLLRPTQEDKHNVEILIPTLPEEAKTQPVLSKKMGLSQPEITALLNDLVPNMCSSKLELTTLKDQFTIGGIAINQEYPVLKNYLGYLKNNTDSLNEILSFDTINFDLKNYLKYLMVEYVDAISEFYILTAINTHNDIIYLTKVGSFDCYIPSDVIYKKIIKCDKEFAILIGSHAVGDIRSGKSARRLESIINLQQSHRSMIIVDLRDTRNNSTPGKIYYFEPFGQFYPVYDVYGRIIPHMPEMVIAKRFKEALSNIKNDSQSTKEFNIVLPLYEDDKQTENGDRKFKACNTSVFQLVNTNYLGVSKSFMGDAINKVINSVSLSDKNKTLDWAAGYCGLIVVFMTVLIKMNCLMGAKGNVDDIFIWFNKFNANPLYTYNNLLSRFLVRGFAQLVEKILAGKIKVIQPKKINLNEIQEEFQNKIMPQFTSYTLKPIDSESKISQQQINQVYNLLGYKEIAAASLDDELEKIKTKLNTVSVYLFNIIQNYNRTESDYKPTDENGNIIPLDNELYKKLLRNREKIIMDENTRFANMDYLRVFGLGITNKLPKIFSKTDKIKFQDEPSLMIFSGKDGQFNPDFPKIIFVNTDQKGPHTTSV